MYTPTIERVWFTRGKFDPDPEWIRKAYLDAKEAPDGVFTEVINGDLDDWPCLFVAAVTIVGRKLGVFITEYDWGEEVLEPDPSNLIRERFVRAVALSSIGRDLIRER